MSVEQWRAIPGYEGSYEVSDLGRVRSIDRMITGASGKPFLRRGQSLAPLCDPDGRRRVRLHRDGQGSTRKVSVLVLEAFVGPRPTSGHDCCHENGDPTDDRRSNLYWGTKRENLLDRVRHGTHCFANRTHCPRGHRLAAPNLIASAAQEGRRGCLACARARSNVAYAKRTRRPYDFIAWADDHYARIMAEAS